MHAVRLVLDNFGYAARISLPLYILSFALVTAIFLSIRPATSSELMLPIVLAVVSYGFFFAWTAVAWHRYILLDEKPTGLLPAFNGKRILAYVGQSLIVGLISLPIAIGASVVTGVVVAAGGPVLTSVATLIVAFAVLVIAYRLTPILPASSLDAPLRLGEAWAATRGETGNIAVLALMSLLGGVLVELPTMLVGSHVVLRFLLSAIAGWLTLMVGISIVTTLYGHYIEGRSVSA